MFIPKSWNTPRVVLGLFITEFAFTVAMLALFGIASPNLFRTDLWGDGSLNGFNSNPNQVLYAYANYKPLPKTPLVWSQFITSYNVVISVLSMFLLLCKAVLNVMHIFRPLLSLFIHVLLTALYAVSVYGQAGPDYSDPQHPSSVPWYLTKSCDVAAIPNNIHYCKMAKATFAVTVIMLSMFFTHIILSIYSLIPTKEMKLARAARLGSDAGSTKESPPSEYEFPPPPTSAFKTPKTPKTPTTPRTKAFNALTSAVARR